MTGTREAARQLRMPPSTLRYWLEGATRNGVVYEPILRPEPTGVRVVTWGEFVEARYLRAYRSLDVPMRQLRTFVGRLRHEFGVPYPLAHYKPFVGSGRRLLLEAQQDADLPEDLTAVYEVASGQLILAPRVLGFIEQVTFARDGAQEAQRIMPAGAASPVVMDPLLSSGSPTVHGIRTEVIAEMVEADTPVERVAADFGLPVDSVKAAVAFEWSYPTSAIAA